MKDNLPKILDKNNIDSFLGSSEFKRSMTAWSRKRRWEPNLAADLHQQLALILWTRANAETIHNGWAFIKQIKFYLERNAFRTQSRLRAISNELDQLAGASPSSDPCENAIHTEQMMMLRKAMTALPERKIKIVVMRSEGMKWADIGQAVGLTVGRVYQIYHQTTQKLKGLMEAA